MTGFDRLTALSEVGPGRFAAMFDAACCSPRASTPASLADPRLAR